MTGTVEDQQLQSLQFKNADIAVNKMYTNKSKTKQGLIFYECLLKCARSSKHFYAIQYGTCVEGRHVVPVLYCWG